jgi:putative FmdB family regulatory protein
VSKSKVIFQNLELALARDWRFIVPIYEYTCEKCHAKAEIIHKVDEKPPEFCPKCHAKNTLKKAVTTSAFHLKGGGWYKDLYASSKSSEASSEAKSPSSESPKAGTSAKAPKKDETK